MTSKIVRPGGWSVPVDANPDLLPRTCEVVLTAMRMLKMRLETRLRDVNGEDWPHIVYNQSVAVKKSLRAPTPDPAGNVEHARDAYRPALDENDARVRPPSDVATCLKLEPDNVNPLPDVAHLPYYARPMSTWTVIDLYNWLQPDLPSVALTAFKNGIDGEVAAEMNTPGWMELGATDRYASEIVVCVRALKKGRPLRAHLGPDQVSLSGFRLARQAKKSSSAVVRSCADACVE
eukprot:SAG31_NODE_8018_length_1539_cov_2.475694_1_plen_234_part_00